MEYPPGHLPHQNINSRPVHVTYRLAGSLPKSILQDIFRRREDALTKLEADLAGLPELDLETLRRHATFKIDANYELAIDQALEASAKKQSFALAKPQIAQLVLDSWLTLQQREKVYCYVICVMGNHAHAVLGCPENREEVKIGRIMASYKKFTARRANELLGRTGQAFWSANYFDRGVRDGKFTTVMWYVLNNPVKAGLVENWREWPHTYLNPDYDQLF